MPHVTNTVVCMYVYIYIAKQKQPRAVKKRRGQAK